VRRLAGGRLQVRGRRIVPAGAIETAVLTFAVGVAAIGASWILS
jgi:hypothetical protein